MLKNTSTFLVVAVLLVAGVLHTNAQQPVRASMDCASLTGLTFEGNTSITSATAVTDGSLVTSPTLTATNLPPFCRVQGAQQAQRRSRHPLRGVAAAAGPWNSKFLSTGEGGFAGQAQLRA